MVGDPVLARAHSRSARPVTFVDNATQRVIDGEEDRADTREIDVAAGGIDAVELSDDATEQAILEAVALLSPAPRHPVAEDPTFFRIWLDHPDAPRLSYLDWTADAERWLAGVAGESFAAACGRRLSLAMARLTEDARRPVDLTVVGAGLALAAAFPGRRLTIARQSAWYRRDSGSGIAYSHDPLTGAATVAGIFRHAAPGELLLAEGGADLVDVLASATWGDRLRREVGEAAERRGEPVIVQFTVDTGTPRLLRIEPGRLPARARVADVAARHGRGELTSRQALARLTADDIGQALVQPGRVEGLAIAGRGQPVAPGIASGTLAFSSADAVAARAGGGRPVLVLRESRPEDLPGLLAAVAVITERGGLTAHAAVVARGLGVPAVAALVDAVVDSAAGVLLPAAAPPLPAGAEVTVDGWSGLIHHGAASTSGPPWADEVDLARWVRSVVVDRPALGVRANVDDAGSAARARDLGAGGVGLCRIEHMFLGERHPVLRRALLAPPGPDLTEAAEEVYRIVRTEAAGMMSTMDGMPVTVRLLDPPRHEFLPEESSAADEFERATARRLREHNPMLGVRGVRLAVVVPELAVAQVRALVDATLAARRAGGDPRPELLIPMVSASEEIDLVRELLDDVCAAAGTTRRDLGVHLGAMVETPRAVLLVAEIARRVDFLSVGTNDLTALVWGLSRDDAEGELLPAYLRRGVVEVSPFEVLDIDGVGSMIHDLVVRARSVRPGITIGVCGEQAASPAALAYLASIDVDYVSCAVPRILPARWAAARQAADGLASAEEDKDMDVPRE